jgi:hypothetical protein
MMMEKTEFLKLLIILIYAFIGWTICGVIMFIGTAVTSEFIALIIHAIAAPIIFAVVSSYYFKRYDFTTPLETAILFVAFVLLMDFFIVALLIEGSLRMFGNVLGTWIPFVLIFLATYYTGQHSKKKA